MENNTSTPEDISSFIKALRIIDAIILLTIALVGVVGNVLVFIAYRVSYQIRTKTNIFVVNLAAADLLTCLLLPIVSWSLLIKVDDIAHWLDVLCGFTIGAIQAFASCSIMMLASIAANRFVLITRSRATYHKLLYQNKFIAVWLILSWIYPMIVVTIPLLFDIGHLGFDPKIHACGARADHPRSYLYDVIVISIVVPIPALITVYCYGGIYFYVRKVFREMEKLQQGNNQNLRQERVSLRQVNVTKSLLYIMIPFVICLTPNVLSELADAHHLIILHTKILLVFGRCVNPIIYGVKHPQFRPVFKCILLRRWSDIPEPA